MGLLDHLFAADVEVRSGPIGAPRSELTEREEAVVATARSLLEGGLLEG